MQYDSKIVAHSISNLENDIITWEITIPKWLVAEFNTHKVEIERNSASSRAVPTKIILDMVKEHPVLPIDWRVNARGMQANEKMSGMDVQECDKIWLEARDAMIPFVERLIAKKADKQRVNRLLESWMWTVVVVTMTGGGGIGINNFFGLRDNDAAQPEFREVARMMHTQYHASTPVERKWHLPYVKETAEYAGGMVGTPFGIIENADDYAEVQKIMAIVSSARCGRVTHYRQGQVYSIDEDLGRGWSFVESGHFSPLRHASKAGNEEWYGNMYGWIPISKLIMPEGKDYFTKCCELAMASEDI